MLREIMVPLDGTSFAEAALPHGLALAARDGARLRLVTVWRPLPPPESSSSWERERQMWQDEDRERLEQYLRDLAREADTAGVPAEVEILEGGVDDVLPRWTAASSVDMVVMATHARKPVIRFWLGSAGDRMLRSGRHPVLLIHPESEEPRVDLRGGAAPRRIVVALDGEDLAERALDASILGGVQPERVRLTLVRVVPLPDATSMVPVPIDQLRAEARDYLAGVATRAAEWAGEVHSDVLVADGVAKAITSAAAGRGADLIAMGTHARKGVARAVLGSVADKVLRTADVPVLMFPPG